MATDTGSPRRATWRWVLTVVVILAAGAALLAAATMILRVETTEEASFELDGVTQIRTVTEAGNVEVSVGDDNNIQVVTELTSSFGSEPRSDVTLENGVLSLDGSCRSLLINICRVTYRITVPRDTALALEVETIAGNVDIRGASGTVMVQTMAGTINMSDHIGVETDLRTTAGNISFVALTPPTSLKVETTAGTIRVRAPDVGYRIDTRTVVGNVSVDLGADPDADRFIGAVTVTGNIDLGRG